MKGFKTIFAAAAISIVGLLQQYGAIDLVPEQYRGLALAGVGVVMAGLRLITTTPVGNRSSLHNHR
jgi:hypothetical protein